MEFRFLLEMSLSQHQSQSEITRKKNSLLEKHQIKERNFPIHLFFFLILRKLKKKIYRTGLGSLLLAESNPRDATQPISSSVNKLVLTQEIAPCIYILMMKMDGCFQWQIFIFCLKNTLIPAVRIVTQDFLAFFIYKSGYSAFFQDLVSLK